MKSEHGQLYVRLSMFWFGHAHTKKPLMRNNGKPLLYVYMSNVKLLVLKQSEHLF